MISVHHLDDQLSQSWSSRWSPSWWSGAGGPLQLPPLRQFEAQRQEEVGSKAGKLWGFFLKKKNTKNNPFSKSKETVAWVTPSHTNTETFTHAQVLHNLKQSKVFLPLIWAIRQMRYSLDQNGTRKSAKVKKRRNFDPVFKDFCFFSMYKISKHFLLILLLGFIWSKPIMISFPNPIDFLGRFVG